MKKAIPCLMLVECSPSQEDLENILAGLQMQLQSIDVKTHRRRMNARLDDLGLAQFPKLQAEMIRTNQIIEM